MTMNEINALAKEALKADDDWNVAQQVEGWGDEEMEKDYDQVVDLLTPDGVKRDRSKVKITHTDNCENDEQFYDLYDELYNLEPIKMVKEYLRVYDVDGTRYAIEYSEGGAYAIFYYSAE